MPPRIRIHFVMDPRATHWPDLAALIESDIDAFPQRFVGGRNSWIAQTYLRLRPLLEARGWHVTTGARFLPGTISVVHRDDANGLHEGAAASFMVVVRADRPPVHACDLAVAQNPLGLAGHERFLPLWPQPGLRPRSRERGGALECLAYQGRTPSAPAWFGDPRFHHELARRNVRFEVRERDWDDYRTVDLALAVREESPRVLATKPATKLYNGWLAGVPVLAAPEPAYMVLKRDPLDFVEVRRPGDILAAIDAFHARPALYEAMVARGHERARAFDVASTRQRWLDFLEQEVAPRFLAARDDLRAHPGRFVRALARQRAGSRWHKWAAGFQRWQMAAGLSLP